MKLNPLDCTVDEWESLPWGVRRDADAPACGARPYHSNYHLCVVIEALEGGESVADRVLASYSGNAASALRAAKMLGERGNSGHKPMDEEEHNGQ